MERRAHKAPELPSWFALSKYQAASTLGAAGWYEQLGVRRTLIELLDSRDAMTPQERARRGLPAIFDAVRASPIVDIGSSRQMQEWFASADESFLGVRLATITDHYWTEGSLERKKSRYARKYFDEVTSDESAWTKPQKLKWQPWMAEPIDKIASNRFCEANIVVNWLLPRRVLTEQFAALLKELPDRLQRNEATIKDERRPNFKSWVKFGVLPYLDLKIWGLEVGKKLKIEAMSSAIFPDDEGGVDVVSKTTTKIAKRLLEPKYLHTLRALAARELAAR
jgi:Family of unknown function (DUF6387)